MLRLSESAMPYAFRENRMSDETLDNIAIMSPLWLSAIAVIIAMLIA